MKRCAVLTLAVIGTAVCLGCGFTPEEPSSHLASGSLGLPKIVFDHTDLDVGDVPVNREHPAEASFIFHNAGESPLHVTRIEKSCRCAIAQVDPLVAPHGEGHVRLKLACDAPQAHQANVVVHSNDPKTKPIRLNVKWRVVAPIEFEPYSVDFGDLLPNQNAEKTVNVVVRAAKKTAPDCEFGTIECQPPTAIAVLWGPTGSGPISRGNSLSLRISLRPGEESGDWQGRVVLPLRNSTLSELILPVRWTVRDIIEALPASLFLGSGKANSSASKRVTLSVRESEELEIAAVHVTPENSPFSASIEKSSSHVAVVRVEACFPPDAGPMKGNLEVLCRRPVERTVNVPITAYSLGSQ